MDLNQDTVWSYSSLMKKPLLFLFILLLSFQQTILAENRTDFFTVYRKNIPLEAKPDYYLVNKVIDGQTLLLSNGERVRFIGVMLPVRSGIVSLLKM